MLKQKWNYWGVASIVFNLMTSQSSYAVLPHEDANLKEVRTAFDRAKEELNLSVPGKYYCEHYHATGFADLDAGRSTLEFKRKFISGNLLATSGEGLEFTFADNSSEKGIPHISSICKLGEVCLYQMNLRRGTMNGESYLFVETTLDSSQIADAYKEKLVDSISNQGQQFALSYGVCTLNPTEVDGQWPKLLVDVVMQIKKPSGVSSPSPLSLSSSIVKANDQEIYKKRVDSIRRIDLEVILDRIQSDPSFFETPVANRYSFINLVVAAGRIDIFQVLLKNKPELIDAKDKDGWTVLHSAAQVGNVPLIQEILKLRPEMLTQVTANGSSALEVAAFYGQLEAFQHLYLSNPKLIDEKSKYGGPVLLVAAKGGSVALIQEILKLRPEQLAQTTAKGTTALHIAALLGKLDSFKYLLIQNRELLTQTDGYDNNILHRIVNGFMVHNLEASIALIDYVRNEHTDAFKLLLTQKNKDAKTPYEIAVEKNLPIRLGEKLRPEFSAVDATLSVLSSSSALSSSSSASSSASSLTPYSAPSSGASQKRTAEEDLQPRKVTRTDEPASSSSSSSSSVIPDCSAESALRTRLESSTPASGNIARTPVVGRNIRVPFSIDDVVMLHQRAEFSAALAAPLVLSSSSLSSSSPFFGQKRPAEEDLEPRKTTRTDESASSLPLISSGQASNNSQSQLMKEIALSHLHSVQEILFHNPQLLECRTQVNKATVLHVAASAKRSGENLKVFKDLFERNPELGKERDSSGKNILHVMVHYRNTVLVNYLKNNDPRLFNELINEKTFKGETVFDFAKPDSKLYRLLTPVEISAEDPS